MPMAQGVSVAKRGDRSHTVPLIFYKIKNFADREKKKKKRQVPGRTARLQPTTGKARRGDTRRRSSCQGGKKKPQATPLTGGKKNVSKEINAVLENREV